MSSQHRKLVGALVVTGAAAVAASSAAASQPAAVHCGETLTKRVRLKADLVDCPGDGLIVGASGITIDLNGHTIDGVPVAGCGVPATPRQGIRNDGGYDRLRQPHLDRVQAGARHRRRPHAWRDGR
jgi:hypothetical protein